MAAFRTAVKNTQGYIATLLPLSPKLKELRDFHTMSALLVPELGIIQHIKPTLRILQPYPIILTSTLPFPCTNIYSQTCHVRALFPSLASYLPFPRNTSKFKSFVIKPNFRADMSIILQATEVRSSGRLIKRIKNRTDRLHVCVRGS
jgi:hypothetical protein